MMLRRCRRTVALAFTVLGCVMRAALVGLFRPLTPSQRALWLQDSGQRVLVRAGIDWRVVGTPPVRGLVVSNHLSYLDIAVFAAAMPCAFVSKVEVSRWPVFGAMARLGGTIFINRASRTSAEAVAREIGGRLRREIPILVFPEGTSTDGLRVLRFHSTLFEPAAAAGAPVTAAAVGYTAKDGTPEPELCWFGDEPFLPNLWRILGVSGLRAEVNFGEPRFYPDRRTAARAAQADVEALRATRNGAAGAETSGAVTRL